MAERNEAPGELELVRAFVNTYDVEADRDHLTDGPATLGWFTERGLLDPPSIGGDVDDATLAMVRQTREALRGLLHSNHTGHVDAAAVEVLNRAADASGLVVRFDTEGATVAVSATGIAAALGELLAIASGAMRDGSWSRLKVCDRDTCRWAFYDRFRNRSGRWCAMEVCGNRTKVETYRERHGSA